MNKKIICKILNIQIQTAVDVNASMEDVYIKNIYQKVENFVYKELEENVTHIDDMNFLLSARFEEIHND